MKNLEKLFSDLSLDRSNGLYITNEENWKTETSFPNRVKKLLDNRIRPDAFFSFDNKPIVLFFENPPHKSLHEDLWNFNESPIIFILKDGVIEIFNGFNYLIKESSLQRLGGNECVRDFTYLQLVTGRILERYNKDLDRKNRVDYHLLNNIRTARTLLMKKPNSKAKVVNAIIGKSIFVRYLIDRKVKIAFDGTLRNWSNDEFCSLLDLPSAVVAFFEYLEDKDKGFNGYLFPLTKSEYSEFDVEDYEIIKRLLRGDELVSSQISLFQLYDFSIIPIEFISNIYELFIGQDNQKKEGAYYTPLFLVDYILTDTVDVRLSTFDECKVLDPACGSGVFLVETLRKLIEKYINSSNVDLQSDEFKIAITNLTEANIFGLDKDASAVQVAVFSIYLTLLDYLEPPSIETFKFPILFNTNFFEGDFFDVTLPFNFKFENTDFDFIIGNPPWSRGKGEKIIPPYIEYILKRKQKEGCCDGPTISIGNKEIAQAFALRVSDFSKPKTKVAFIVTSKVLYNRQSLQFREYFLKNFHLSKVLELSPVRREVFNQSSDKAITPACVIFFQYAQGNSTEHNLVQHISLKPSKFFSLFKIFTINRTDFKNVQQSKLISYDWLWKVLLYGSYLDFNFLSRIKSDYKSIGHFLSQKAFLVKQGIKRKDGQKKINTEELIGWDFLDLDKKELKQLHISPNHSKWSLGEVGYIYRTNGNICQKVFLPPVLLIKETVNTRLESVSAVSYKKILFTDKVTSVKIMDDLDTDHYYMIAALLNSTFFAYFALITSSTAGVMIEQQIHDEERFDFPYRFSKDVVDATKRLEELLHNQAAEILSDNTREIEITKCKSFINKSILELFEMDSSEIALIDYATQIAIPIMMRQKSYKKLFDPLDLDSFILLAYADVFLKKFEDSISTNTESFCVEILYSKEIIGMLFKVVDKDCFTSNVVTIDCRREHMNLLKLLSKLSNDHLTDRLFVQKDIRGFEENYFYVFKPNEHRLWHESIAYLDANEFATSILKAGRFH